MDVTEARLPEPVHVDVNGTRIATYVLQPDAREPLADVVFCHGTPWSSLVWGAAARFLSDDYRVFLWDMPGYGQSAKEAATPVDLEHQMSRLAQLLSHWRIDRPHVVAHDIGGAVALGAHLLHEMEYSGLYLWDVVALEPWGSQFFRLVADHEQVFSALPPARHAALVREYIAGAARHQLTPEWVDALAQPWLGTPGQPAFYRQVAQLRPAHTRPVSSQLSKVRCPVGVGWGKQDPWLPISQAFQLQQQLPGDPPLVELSNTGHLAPVENPAAVHRALHDWLAIPAGQPDKDTNE
jgi:pimeloyl-ACP methyl ester carboxylesterase